MDGLSFSLCSSVSPCIFFRQEKFCVKIFEIGAWPHLSIGVCDYPMDIVASGSISPVLGITVNAIPVGS